MTWPIVLLCIAAPFLVFGVRLTRSVLHQRRRLRFMRAYMRAKAEARHEHWGRN